MTSVYPQNNIASAIECGANYISSDYLYLLTSEQLTKLTEIRDSLETLVDELENFQSDNDERE